MMQPEPHVANYCKLTQDHTCPLKITNAALSALLSLAQGLVNHQCDATAKIRPMALLILRQKHIQCSKQHVTYIGVNFWR